MPETSTSITADPAPAPGIADVLHELRAIRSAVDQNAPELLDAKALAQVLSLSVSSVWAASNAGYLPEPLTIGDLRAPRWSAREIRAWVAAGCPVRARWAEMRVAALRRAG